MARKRKSCRVRRAQAGDMLAALRLILDNRAERCSRGCKGWFVNGETLNIERCDECAHDNGYQDDIDDTDVATLPEAQRARRRAWYDRRLELEAEGLSL